MRLSPLPPADMPSGTRTLYDELVVLIAFNTDASEPQDDIGLVASFSALSADVLGAIFGTSPETFRIMPRNTERAVIARRPGFEGERS